MSTRTNRHLVSLNLAWLKQALDLVRNVSDDVFAIAPASLPGYKVGSHVRHILEFYECFLHGLPSGRVDYDRRSRDFALERSRKVAEARILSLMDRLGSAHRVVEGTVLLVSAENAASGPQATAWLNSSVARELQVLSSHTIHHFALIAVTLRAHGVDVDPEFGVAPSTLRYLAAQQQSEAQAA